MSAYTRHVITHTCGHQSAQFMAAMDADLRDRILTGAAAHACIHCEAAKNRCGHSPIEPTECASCFAAWQASRGPLALVIRS